MYGAPISVKDLNSRMSNYMHQYCVSYMGRPVGISALIGGWNEVVRLCCFCFCFCFVSIFFFWGGGGGCSYNCLDFAIKTTEVVAKVK